MNLDAARQIADGLVRQMRPYCERAEIAGSIRREKPDVKDIEIVAVPTWELAPVEEQVRDLFGHPGKLPDNTNLLHFWAMKLAREAGVRWIKPGTSEVIPWEPKPDGKYWRGLVDETIKLDLFLASRDNFGLIYLIRTGSADFSEAVVTHAKRIGLPCKEGFLRDHGEPQPTREEPDVFARLGLEYVEPRLRVDSRGVRPANRHREHSGFPSPTT
jgi:DNA polymerase/3'-5' exonuclease PolX